MGVYFDEEWETAISNMGYVLTDSWAPARRYSYECKSRKYMS